ncbi:MAG: hypothetical protein ACI8RD_014238, partial [Bacillariaceae sp.]
YTNDGESLGPMARQILKNNMKSLNEIGAGGENNNNNNNDKLVVTQEVANYILENVGLVLSSPDKVTIDDIRQLFATDAAAAAAAAAS